MAPSLVIQAARFGDLVQSRLLMIKLAKAGEVHLLVDMSLAPLAKLIYPFAHIHSMNFHSTANELAEGRQLLENNRKTLAELHNISFGRIYNLNFSAATASVCRLFEPEKIVGHRPAPGGVLRSGWVRLAFRLGSRRRITPLNLVDYWGYFADWQNFTQNSFDQDCHNENCGAARPGYDAKSLSACDIDVESMNPGNSGHVDSIHDYDCLPAKPGGRGLGVVMAGRVARRSLPIPLLASLVQTASAMLGSKQIYLFGTASEEHLASRLLRQLQPGIAKRVVNLCGKTDWAALIENLTGLDALISPDTGTMHLAALLGVPILGFFLSNAWCHETGPYGRGHKIFQALPDCAPCLEAAPCPSGTICLNKLQSPELLRSVARCLTGERNFAMPDGVACMESSIDSFGLRYAPICGAEADKDQAKRESVRLLISNFVASGMGRCSPGRAWQAGKLPDTGKTIAAAEMAGLAEWLFPESEWMLPAWRYC